MEHGRFRTGDGTIPLDGCDFGAPVSGSAWMGARPEDVAIGDAAAGCATSSEVVTELVEPMGADTLVWTTFAGQPFRFAWTAARMSARANG